MVFVRWGLILALLTCVGAVKMHTELHLNPIRRVVTLLQVMQKKVTQEGEEDKERFDRAMCYCREQEDGFTKSISEAEAKMPQLQSDANAGDAEKTQLISDIAQAQEARAAAQKTLDESKAVRTKEAQAFAKQDAEDEVNWVALGKAETALKSSTQSILNSFLQSPGVDVLRHYAQTQDLADWDKKTLASFLSSRQGDGDSEGDGYEPGTDDVLGIISQMKEELEKDRKEGAAAEKKSGEDYDALVTSKKKEMAALNHDLQTKTARQGEVAVELVNIADDLDGTEKLHTTNKASLEALTKDCDSKAAQFDRRTHLRSEEQQALSDTMELLNSDDASQLFKKSLSSPSLMQLRMTTPQLLKDARQVLAKQVGKLRDPRLDLINMAMRGKKANFSKVLVMIEKMVTLLGKEQKDDEAKVQYCKDELDKANDEKSTLENSISDSKKSIANSKDILGTVKTDIARLGSEIKALGASVSEATVQRKTQNAAFVEELASNNAAINVLIAAKSRLNEFYAPKKPALAQKRAAVKAAVTDAFSFLQVNSKANPVIALLDTLLQDVKKQVAEMKSDEQDAQSEYERFMRDASAKRSEAAKALSVKESEKAEREGSMTKHTKEMQYATAEADGTDKYLQSLHEECDWMMKNYDARQSARTSEINALKQAKAVLSGADMSFLQLEQVKRDVRTALRR